MYDMSNFLVVYEGRALNAIGIDGIMYGETENGIEDGHIGRVQGISVLALDTDGTLIVISDKASKFQFLPKVRE